MAGGADDFVGHFRLAYQAVVRFPVLIVPPLAVAVLGFMLLFFIGGGAAVIGALMGGAMGGSHGAAAGGIAGLVLGALVFVLVMGTLGLLSSGMVIVMARSALGGAEPVLGDALAAVARRLGAIAVAASLVGLIVMIGFLFLVIPGIVAAVFLMFTLPAVLPGRARRRRRDAPERGPRPGAPRTGRRVPRRMPAGVRRRGDRVLDPLLRSLPRRPGLVRAARRRDELPDRRRRALLPAAPSDARHRGGAIAP